MSDFIVNDGFNLFVGDAGPDNSKHLIIKNLKMPDMEEMTAEHHSGGSTVGIEVGGLGMKPFACAFKLAGYDVQTMSQFGIGTRTMFPFTAYGNAKSKLTGDNIAVKCVMKGRLVSLKRPEHERGKILEVDHEVKEILYYEEWYGNEMKYGWDWGSGALLVDGVVQNQDELDNLGIPSAF